MGVYIGRSIDNKQELYVVINVIKIEGIEGKDSENILKLKEAAVEGLIKREKIFDNIIVTSGTKKEAIRTISRLCATHRLLDEVELEEAFLKREEWDSTGCGEGIAIPHAIIKGTNKVQLAIIRFRYPIEWEAFDDKPVDIAFAIIAPKEEGQERYLAFLSYLARKLVDEEFVARFRECRNAEEMYQYLMDNLEN